MGLDTLGVRIGGLWDEYGFVVDVVMMVLRHPPTDGWSVMVYFLLLFFIL